MKKKPRKIRAPKGHDGKRLKSKAIEYTTLQLGVVPIVSDGAIAQGNEAQGRLIPVLILDTSGREDVRALFRAHSTQPPGDVDYIWRVSRREPYAVYLTLNFSRPVRTSFSVILPVEKYGGLVDLALANRLISLQSGRVGDRLSQNLVSDRVVVQIGSESFESVWEAYFLEATTNHLMKEGLSKSEAILAAEEKIRTHRKLNNARASPPRTS